MQPRQNDNSAAWGLSRVVDFFDFERSRPEDLYESERIFLDRSIREEMTILDIGCAQGGLAGIVGERLKRFSYTGLDISVEMLARARARFPQHEFLQVREGDLSPLAGRRFDLVVVLGILHLQERWRDVARSAWEATDGRMILDLRETHLPGIEDKERSYFRMDFNGGAGAHAQHRLPYNIINTAEALEFILALCPGEKIARYGYMHPPSPAAVTTHSRVMTSVYCVDRCSRR